MVLTRGQQAGDSSSADHDRYPISTGNPMVALTSNDASGITVSASGDANGSAQKPVHGSQSGRLASMLTSANQSGPQACLSTSPNERQIALGPHYNGSPTSSDPHTPDSDSAGPTRFDNQGPSMLEPSDCLVYTTHAASGIQTNASTMAPQVPPAIRPTFFGNYSPEAGVCQPNFRREITNHFGLPEPRPSRHGEPTRTVPTAMASDYQTSVLHQQAPRNLTLLDVVLELMAPRPAPMGEPQEVPKGPTTAAREFPSTTGAL